MKKLTLAVLFSLLTFAGLNALEAKVVSVTGKVEQQRGSSWIAVKQGDTLQKGAVISTGFNSSAVLSVSDSTITVGALTRMTIEQLASNAYKDDTQVFIDSGKISADVKHTEDRRSDFKVRSPVATASVRGTQIGMDAGGAFFVSDGMADYGPAEAAAPQIQSELPADEGSRAQGSSNVFTSTQTVGGSYGTPVYAGWESSTDTTTGIRSDPQDNMGLNSTTFASSTGGLAQQEAAGIFTYPESSEAGNTGGLQAAKITIKVSF